MKVGDLATLRWGEHPRPVGMIVARFPRSSALGDEYDELRVRWLDGKGREVWLWRKELEVVNESR